MKALKKIVAFSLLAVFLASGTAIPSLAVSLPLGTGCGAGQSAWNAGWVSSDTQNSGSDAFSGCQASSGNTSDGGTASAETFFGCLQAKQALQAFFSRTGQASCSALAGTDDDTAVPAAEAADVSDPGTGAAAVPDKTAGCAAADASAVPAESDSADSGAGICIAYSGQCRTSTAAGTSKGSRLFGYLSRIFETCGIDLSKCGVALPDCGGTSEALPLQPADETDAAGLPSSGSTGTAQPADPGTSEAAVPTSGGTEAADHETAGSLSFEQQVAELVNEQRALYGLAPLTLSETLSDAARAKSQDMHDNQYFSHTSPTYGSPFEMLRSFDISYTAAGENIAMGYATPEAVMDAWMNSSGHRANILNASYTQIGVGYVADGNYWTQEFIG